MRLHETLRQGQIDGQASRVGLELAQIEIGRLEQPLHRGLSRNSVLVLAASSTPERCLSAIAIICSPTPATTPLNAGSAPHPRPQQLEGRRNFAVAGIAQFSAVKPVALGQQPPHRHEIAVPVEDRGAEITCRIRPLIRLRAASSQ